MANRAAPSKQGESRELEAVLPAASLIICSRNRPGLLTDTVASVLRGDEVPAELVIVDQSGVCHHMLSSAQEERGCTIKYLWTRSVGTSRARNEGIRAARHRIVAIIDDDMLADAGWYGALIRAL